MLGIDPLKRGRTNGVWKSAKLAFLLLGLLSACGGGYEEQPPPPPEPTSSYVWTWVSGSNIEDQGGIYGTKGTADPTNVPGARWGAVSWMDSGGKLWLFGGNSFDGLLNDLWNFDPATLEWTWVSGSDSAYQAGIYGTKGIPDPANVPGARAGAVSWIDSNDELWLFGGDGAYWGGVGVISIWLNDLWKFDPATLEWTWVSGSDGSDSLFQAGIYGTKGIPDPANVPGSRTEAVSWIDSSDKLWLFGGDGRDGSSAWGELNDLWTFDPATLEWTWISGSETINQPGVYGTRGLPDPMNVPGARCRAVSWIDSGGNLWLFGGYGFCSNDLWKYNPTTLEWTWIAGMCESHYGTMGKAAASNAPGGRFYAMSWADSNDKLWLFGGDGYDENLHFGRLNDLWKFDPASLEWTWESGHDYVNDGPGTYGTKGTANASNLPGGRYSAVTWIDSNDKLWLFGGLGLDSVTEYGEGSLNDLWKCVHH